MVQSQSSLGGRQVHRVPTYQQTKIGRVTSIKDYKKYGKIEVVFLDHGQPFPVWVVGSIEREPVTGDQVLVGYMEGRKDAPYMMGFVRNESYTSNFIEVSKDRIRIQLPVLEIGVKNGKAHNDVKEHLLNDSKKAERGYLEITASGIDIHHPTGTIQHHGGTSPVARKGDGVAVDVNGVTYYGSITEGSSKTLIK